MYERKESDPRKTYIFKRIYFCRAIITVLARIDQAESKAREAVFESNLNHVEARRRMDDFESLFLTLLNAAHTFDDKSFVEKGLNVNRNSALGRWNWPIFVLQCQHEDPLLLQGEGCYRLSAWR